MKTKGGEVGTVCDGVDVPVPLELPVADHCAKRMTSALGVMLAPGAKAVPAPTVDVFHPVNEYPERVNEFASTV